MVSPEADSKQKSLIDPFKNPYFTPRDWEDHVYRLLVVNRFRKWLLTGKNSPNLGKEDAKLTHFLPPGQSVPRWEQVQAFENLSIRNERSHMRFLMCFQPYWITVGIVTGIAIDPVFGGIAIFAGEVSHVVSDIYPIMVQRQTRLRIKRIRNRFKTN